MKKNKLLQIALSGAVLTAMSLAHAEPQYPASDFQPKVLYQDTSVKSGGSSSEAKYPATDFQPKVVYESSNASSGVKSAPVVEHDPKFPAANFEPKVLYSDSSYQHSTSAPSLTSKSESNRAASSSSAYNASATSSAPAETGDSNLLILGALLAVAGVVLFKKNGCPWAKKGSSTVKSGETGVARYLKAREPKISSVTKYLERTGTPTNVARYIARQSLAQKNAQNSDDRG